MLRLLPTILILLASTRALLAEPLDRRQIPATAVWVVHLDADAARDSLVGQRLRDLWLSRPESAKAMEQARQYFGIDPTRDIRSITLYGTTYAPDAGVVIARGKIDRERLIRTLGAAPGYHAEIELGHTIYHWTESDPNRRHESAGAFFQDDTFVIAPDTTAAAAALSVLEGKSPALASDSALVSEITPGAIVQASATGLAEAKALSIQSPIIRQCQSGSLTVGEQAGQVFLRGRIVTSSADTATRLCELIVGARAMAEFQNPDDADLRNLAHALNVTAVEKAVDIQWKYSSVDLVKIVLTEQARRPATTQPGQGQP